MKYLTAVLILSIIIISLNKEIIAQNETLDIRTPHNFHSKIEFSNRFDSLKVPGNKLFPKLNKNNTETGYLLSEKTTAKWDSTNWKLDKQSVYSYDVKNNLIELVNFNWEGINWLNSGKYKYSYNSSLNLTESLYWWWRNSNWELMFREIYVDDANQNNIEYKWLSYASLTWYTDFKAVFEYDKNNKLIQKDFFQWIGKGLLHILIGQYKYDSRNNLVEYSSEGLRFSNGLWTNIEKITYTYNENNLLIEKIWSYWVDNDWKNSTKKTNCYEGNNLVESTEMDWIDSAWINYHKVNITYNVNNEMVDSTIKWWNDIEWVNASKRTLTYDINHNIIEENKQGWDDSIWVDYRKTEYKYIPVHIPSGKFAGYLLSNNYPNPFNPTTNIQFKLPNVDFVTLKIYDAKGSEVATLINNEMDISYYNIIFDATGLASGVYFYRLQAGDFSETKKMIFLK